MSIKERERTRRSFCSENGPSANGHRIAKLKVLHEDRRRLQPDPEKSPTPIPELENSIDVDVINGEEAPFPDSEEDEEPLTSRSLRRGIDRAAERKRKRDEEKGRRERAAEAKQNRGSKEFQKVLKNISKERGRIEEAEDAIASVDNELREADVPRTRVLGKDRFWNRYYWFERNAMPYEGYADGSTSDAEYMNGRLWVQGPDDMERKGFIDVSEEEIVDYHGKFQLTPAERKTLEEGPTNVFTAHQWGYYENPEDVEMLLGWLDNRGHRELKLRKELLALRDVIVRYMEKRKAYLAKRGESDEPATATRMSTRKSAHVDDENRHRCLRWKNTYAMRVNGHRHIDPPPRPRPRGKRVLVDEGIATRATTNRQGKPLTRQGTRYQF